MFFGNQINSVKEISLIHNPFSNANVSLFPLWKKAYQIYSCLLILLLIIVFTNLDTDARSRSSPDQHCKPFKIFLLTPEEAVGMLTCHSAHTYVLPIYLLPMEKVFRELRGHWSVAHTASRGALGDVAVLHETLG